MIAKKDHYSSTRFEVTKRLHENFPIYPTVYYKMACVSFLNGNYNQAIKTLEHYFQYDLGERCQGDSLLVMCYLHLEQYEKVEDAVINAEKYLKPEALDQFYCKAAKSIESHLNYLEKEMDKASYLGIAKHMEKYQLCDTLFDKIEAMSQADYMKDYIESDEKLPYFYALEDAWSANHSTNDVNLYIDSLGLEDCDKMSMKLIAAEFFAQENLYDASKKCLTEVERYKEKDAPLKEQFENTQKQVRLIKIKNKQK